MESNINYFSECDCDANGAVGGKKGCDSKGECKCQDGFYGPQCKSKCDCGNWNIMYCVEVFS